MILDAIALVQSAGPSARVSFESWLSGFAPAITPSAIWNYWDDRGLQKTVVFSIAKMSPETMAATPEEHS